MTAIGFNPIPTSPSYQLASDRETCKKGFFQSPNLDNLNQKLCSVFTSELDTSIVLNYLTGITDSPAQVLDVLRKQFVNLGNAHSLEEYVNTLKPIMYLYDSLTQLQQKLTPAQVEAAVGGKAYIRAQIDHILSFPRDNSPGGIQGLFQGHTLKYVPSKDYTVPNLEALSDSWKQEIQADVRKYSRYIIFTPHLDQWTNYDDENDHDVLGMCYDFLGITLLDDNWNDNYGGRIKADPVTQTVNLWHEIGHHRYYAEHSNVVFDSKASEDFAQENARNLVDFIYDTQKFSSRQELFILWQLGIIPLNK